jgi:NAD(P)-dependent dehydrogenase (short-subunit alcohol dehydrogenase family)
MTKACTPLLEKSSSGRVINIGSIDGIRIPTLETYAYSTSKAAVHQLSKHLAVRLASKNITVNAIAAGAFETKMMKETLDKFKDIILNGIPLNRIGSPADIAGLCIFLSSKVL